MFVPSIMLDGWGMAAEIGRAFSRYECVGTITRGGTDVGSGARIGGSKAP
jgi:hypothetical protein